MRHLYLLRHAKSARDDEGLADHDRPLEPRGERACERIGALLGRSVPLPALTLCSSARRAIDTVEQVLAHVSPTPPLRIEPSLYLASPSDLHAVLAAVEDGFPSVLVVGHNPGLHAFALALASSEPSEARQRLAHALPTAGLVQLRLPIDRWSQLAPGAGELLRFVRPRDLPPS